MPSTTGKKVRETMKFYVATTLTNSKNHNFIRDELKQKGHEISYDWTKHGSVQLVSIERLQEVAIIELSSISSSDFVVVLLPGGKGTHIELGYAIASKKRIFVHSEDPSVFKLGPQTNAFYHHPNVECFSCPLNELVSQIEEHISFGAGIETS